MKKFPRVFAVLLALILVATIIPAAYAAGTAPGKQASVSFSFKNVCGIDGKFTFSNPAIISGVTYSENTTLKGGVENDEAFYYGSKETDITITVSFKISASAKDGDKCDVSFRYETSDVNGDMSEWNTVTKTVTVEIPDTPTEPKPTEPKPTEPKPTEPKPTQPKPTEPVSTVDYTELKNQISAAKALKADGYTAPSWQALQDALAMAEEALKSKDQSVVDAASAALAEAIKNLQKLDYTALMEAIEKTETFLNSDAMDGKGGALLDALQGAKALLNNAKNQEDIDKAAAALLAALTALDEVLKQLGGAPAVVEPTDDYCNISIHYVWPILFFVCLAINLAFVALVVWYLRRRKKENDDTPLVNYDIDDDI